MANRLEHEDRRRRVADAVCALAAEHGLDGVSVREVAVQSGLSLGAVQRCFATKDAMLSFTLTEVGKHVLSRIAADGADSAAARLALVEPEMRGQARVWLTFVARAAVDPELAKVLRDSYTELTAMFTRLLADVAEPETAARELLAFIDGITTHVLIGQLESGEALAMIDRRLRVLRGG